MRKILAATFGTLVLLVFTAVPSSAAIRGDYIEVRSADVYTGPCFANAEVGLVGDQAILAWKIKHGTWKDVSLDGLGIVAVVKASATLGDPYHDPYPAKAVLIVDERANGRQRQALQEFVQSLTGQLLKNVVRVDAAPINLEVGKGDLAGSVKLTAGNLARIETRSLCAHDHICGNEFVYYPPLVRLASATPAFTLNEAFSGQGLGVQWNRADKRSAFIGTFTL
jgi:hypothetical protein